MTTTTPLEPSSTDLTAGDVAWDLEPLVDGAGDAGVDALLEGARAEGASLVVGVNSDTSVRRLQKGSDRPLVPGVERARLVAALAAVLRSRDQQ